MVVADLRLDMYDGFLCGYLRIGDKYTSSGHFVLFQLIGKVQLVGHNKPDIPVDSAVIIKVQILLGLSRRSKRIIFRRNFYSQHIVFR